MNISLKQTKQLPDQAEFDRLKHWILLLPEGAGEEVWRRVPYGEVLQRRYRAAGGKNKPPVLTELSNEQDTRVSLACAEPGLGSFEQLTLARKLVAALWDFKPTEMGVLAAGFEDAAAERIAEALLAALLARNAELPNYKSKREARTPLAGVQVFGAAAEHGYRRTFAMAAGNNLARFLTGLPPNELTPASYRERVAKLAREHGWEMEFLDVAALRQRKAGAFLAVAQGSPEADAGIVRLSYRPRAAASQRKLALVGKGVCFDTGGVNLKPANLMRGMHKDMQGSAVALGTFLALSQLEVGFPMECWMALVTNHIGPRAYKPDDVVTAVDGTTIEIVHTDAEGRMILADTLALASQGAPSLIIDYATLTGSCKRALGNAFSGIFTNRDEHLPLLIAAGRASGERVWPFPQDEDYDKALESTIADVKQCAEEGEADHILAGRFLRRFVKGDVPWLHLDLSSGTHKGGLGHVPSDATGFGVRFTVSLLLDSGFLELARQRAG
jgi:leucyl aminopeptidase